MKRKEEEMQTSVCGRGRLLGVHAKKRVTKEAVCFSGREGGFLSADTASQIKVKG